MKKRMMHRILALLCAATLILGGCSQEGEQTSTEETKQSEGETTTEQETIPQTPEAAAATLEDLSALEQVEETDLLADQRKVSDQLSAELDKGYTLDEPMIVVNPYGNSPLTAAVIFTTKKKVSVQAVIKSKGKNTNDITIDFGSKKKHLISIYGLYAGDKTQVELQLSDGTKKTIEIETEKLSTTSQEVETSGDASSLDPDQFTFATILTADSAGYCNIAYDNDGKVRWILTGNESCQELERAANGHLFVLSDVIVEPYYYTSGIYEMDMNGKIYRYFRIPGGTHHDLKELSDGNLLVCVNRTNGDSNEDYVVEINRGNGAILYELDLAEVLDPSDGGSVNRSDDDWFHNNSIDYLEDQDLIILSGRHIDGVVAIHKTEKTLAWILGDPDGWTTVDSKYFFTPDTASGDFEWSYAQHDATMLDDTHVLLFDNGAGRTKTTKEDQRVTGDDVYSRAVEYEIDTTNMTVKQVWQYGKERGPQWSSLNVSGVQQLDSDTFWITSGANRYNTKTKTYDVSLTETENVVKTAYMSLVKGTELMYEMKFPGFLYRSIRMTMYPEKYSFSLDYSGKYLGSLGEIPTISAEGFDAAGALPVDFTITNMSLTPDRFLVTGSWESTQEDAALILADETGKTYAYAIDQAANHGKATPESFSGWTTSKSLEQGHTYRIYLYNGGKTYNTDKAVTFLVNTRTSSKNEGAQYAQYAVKEDGTQVVSETNAKISATDIATDTSLVERSQSIYDQLQAEATKGFALEDAEVILNPYQTSPLSALILFSTKEESRVRVTVKGKKSDCDITGIIDSTKDHMIPVAGLYPDYKNKVLLEVLDDQDQVTEQKEFSIETDALPEKLQNAVTVDKEAKESSVGLMLVSGLSTPFLYAFDKSGDIRWYYTEKCEYYGAFPLSNGRLLAEAKDVLMPNASMPNSPEFQEIDFLGRAYRTYFFPEGVHHDITEKEPGGNLMFVTNSQTGYEQDMISEIDRTTGEVVKSLNFSEMMKDCEYIKDNDWAHINTVSYDTDSDTVLISPRNLSSAFCINWSNQEIQWILSSPGIWENSEYASKVLTPQGDINWFYEQHSIYRTGTDLDGDPDTIEIALYDNHSIKHREVEGYDNQDYSYVKIFAINEQTKTAKELRTYSSEFSQITSNYQADFQNNRIFSCNAYLLSGIQGKHYGVIYEYDVDTQEALGRYLISHHYYRGYNLTLDLNSLVNQEEKDLPSYIGTLHNLAKVEAVPIPSQGILKEEVTLKLVDQYLYLRATDHTFTQVIFNGSDGNTFVYDISKLKQMQRNGHPYTYQIPIPLMQLGAGTYTLQIMYENQLWDLAGSITVE